MVDRKQVSLEFTPEELNALSQVSLESRIIGVAKKHGFVNWKVIFLIRELE